MNHIFVSNNNIKSDEDYAINFNETGSLTVNDVNVTVTQSNVLTSANGVGLDVAYLPPGNVNSSTGTDSNQTIIITSSNYTSWFENGIAKVLSISQLDKIPEKDKFVIFRSKTPENMSLELKQQITETAQKIAGFFGVSVGHLLGQEQSDVLDQVDVAFYGDFKELNEEEKETVRDMVRLMRERRTGKQRN